MQTSYPQCITVSKSSNRVQALLWLLIAAVLFVIYSNQPDKGSTLSLIQIALIIFFAILAIVKLLINSSKLTYTPTGSIIEKQTYNFSITLQTEILYCLKEGNTSRLKALKNDDSGGLLVELLESQDHLYIAARLLKYEPYGYIEVTDWITMKR